MLSTREREVLALMAEGRSNAGIGRQLWVTAGTIEKHVSSILTKLNLPETDNDHRRVRAVIAFLEAPQVSRESSAATRNQRRQQLIGEPLCRAPAPRGFPRIIVGASASFELLEPF